MLYEVITGIVNAVRDVNFSLEKGELLGIVGESGSGKSVGMLAVMGLLAGNGRITEGEIWFNGRNISPVAEEFKNDPKGYDRYMKQIRGKDLSMIFQDPMTYRNNFV